jgi:hypothetical protein
MKKVIITCTTRNFLRFIVPIVEGILEKCDLILYCNEELKYDLSRYQYLLELQYKNDNFKIISINKDISSIIDKETVILVTSGSSSPYHQFEYEFAKKSKSFAIQHGLSQEGITRLPHYTYSADYVLTWVKEEYIHEEVATPKEKFIPVGIPNHYFQEFDYKRDGKVFFLGNFFEKDNSSDIKLETSSSEWAKIYTRDWKEKTWDTFFELSNNNTTCYFILHPAASSPSHPTFQKILNNPTNYCVDTAWLNHNNLSRSSLYSLAKNYYITYPSSCFVECFLRNIDYEVFVDYNSNIPILVDIEKIFAGINVTDKIINLLIS